MRNVSIRFFSVLALVGSLAAVPGVGSAQVMVYDPSAVTAAGYPPVYYIDHLIFFDAYGRPYYYDNDQAYYVPETYAEYPGLANHYRMYQAQYLAWYQAVGHRLLNYTRPVAASYYTPEYYEGSVVYYDVHGRPMYYQDGTRYYVPVTSPYYRRYTNHWRRNRPHYDRWYRDYGRSYVNYRRAPVAGYYTPKYYEGYVVYYDDAGLPYYYGGGRQIYVPRTSPYWNTYHSHWRTNRTHYSRWNREHGNTYRSYRTPSHLRGRTSQRVPENRFRPGHHRPVGRGPGHVGPGGRGPGHVGPGGRGPAGRGPGHVGPGGRGPAGRGPGHVGPGGRGPGPGRGPGHVGPGGRGPGSVGPGGRGPGGRGPAGMQPDRRNERRPAGMQPDRRPAGRGPARDNMRHR